MSDEFEVLFYGFGGQGVLSEDQVLSIDKSVHLTHRHVWKKILVQSKRRDICNHFKMTYILLNMVRCLVYCRHVETVSKSW